MRYIQKVAEYIRPLDCSVSSLNLTLIWSENFSMLKVHFNMESVLIYGKGIFNIIYQDDIVAPPSAGLQLIQIIYSTIFNSSIKR